MKMVIIVVIVAVLLIGGAVWYMNQGTLLSPSSSGTLVVKDTPGSVSGSTLTTARVINVKASRFSYDLETITVKKGEHVKIVIDNSDTTHGMVIPDLGVSGIGSVEFTADKVGTYPFKCPTMCGSGHKDMKGTLIVQE